MTITSSTVFLITALILLLPTQALAFGAGDIPDFAFLNDKAFRHGDIENVLENLVKTAGGAALGGGSLLGFAQSVIKHAAGGSKFSRSDVKKVYFGNWLRDYSQAMDIAGLSKLTSETLILIVSVLGFMTFGFATEEFQVTADRLGVYLPVEHIDNPKGYAEKEGDARQFHPKLRPPVDPRELEIDRRTGMKNYMMTEGQGWDTSTAFIRRTFRACIQAGRRSRGQEGPDLWEAYRLLGTGLHTMEDLLAHSNWCEVALQKLGYKGVFCHVGDNVIIDTPNGPAPPLVTGTFGGADFLHSLLGEAGDKLSQASVTDLSNKMNQASQDQNVNSNIAALKNILGKLPIGGGDDKMNKGEEIHAQAKAYNFDPNNIAPAEVQRQLWELLKWRDDIMRDILSKIEMVPGLSDLLDELSNALNAYVYTVLAPYLVPILTQATGVLDEGSQAVIDNHDQYEVFNDPRASDPSHSLLSKDHFGLILNEPAGKIAQVVVEHSVNLIVQAWGDNSDPDQVINKILEAFHHPYYANGRSEIQHKMFEHMRMWISGLGEDEAQQVIQALTKESVRAHKNKRIGSEEQNFEEPGYVTGQSAYGGSTEAYSQYGNNQNRGKYGGQTTYDHDSRNSRNKQSIGGSESNRYASGGGYNQPRREDNYESKASHGRASEGAGSGYSRADYTDNSKSSYGDNTRTHRLGTDEADSYRSEQRRGQDYNTPFGRSEEPSYGESRVSSYGTGGASHSSAEYEKPTQRQQHGYVGRETESLGSGQISTYGSGGYKPSYDTTTTRRDDDSSYSRSETYKSSGYGGRSGGDEYESSGYKKQGYQSYGQDESSSYLGSGNRSSRNDSVGEGHERRRGEDSYASNYDSTGYGQQARETEYSGEHSSKHGKHHESSFGGNLGADTGGYRYVDSDSFGGGRERRNEESYGADYGASSGYGRQGQDSEHSGEQYGRREKHHQSSYGENERSSGYGRSDDTFGAEKLKISDNSSDDDERRSRKHKHGKKYDD